MSKIKEVQERIKEIELHLTELSVVKEMTPTLNDSIVYWTRELEIKKVYLQRLTRMKYDH